MPDIPRSENDLRATVSRLVYLPLCALVLGCLGCANGPLARAGLSPFFDRPESTSYLTPPKRTEQLRDLAKKASKKSPDERLATVTDLTRQIQAEEDPLMRERLLKAVAAHDTTLTPAVLKAGLRDNDSSVRITSIKLLAQRGSSDAAVPLAELARSETDLDVRLAATRELKGFHDRVAIDAVAAGLEDKDPAVRYRTMESLAEMTDKNLGLNVVAWRDYLRNDASATDNGPSLAEGLRKSKLF